MNQQSILLVDDELDLIGVIKELLEMYDYTVVCAQNGKEAYEKTITNNFDLIISDFKMPKYDGLDFLKMLSIHYKEKTPIIMMSAYSDLSETELVKNGARFMISKPISGQDLLSKIRSLIGKNS